MFVGDVSEVPTATLVTPVQVLSCLWRLELPLVGLTLVQPLAATGAEGTEGTASLSGQSLMICLSFPH